MPRNDPPATIDRANVAHARKLLARERKQLPRMAMLYKLLANEARLKILQILSATEKMCVGDLAQVLELSNAATSQQLKMLREHGWLRSSANGKLVYYSLAEPGLADALAGDLVLLRQAGR
ncbi:MAG: metalloregulator ArsR/SmtB family transcription factor [Gammaproteobacteria bacterium]